MATEVGNQAFIAKLRDEVFDPGARELLATPFFADLREGTLTSRRLEGFAIQHFLHNIAILKFFALGMTRNAGNNAQWERIATSFAEEEWTHPAMCKKFGVRLGLSEEDFNDATLIYEEEAFLGTVLRHMYMGDNPAVGAVSGMINEGLLQVAATEMATVLAKPPYGYSNDDLEFFVVHGHVDIEHSARAAAAVARLVASESDERKVEERARDLVRFQIAKFNGIYEHYR